MIDLRCGDALDVLGGVSGCEAVVCDPPSGIAFMGLRFDTDHGGADKWVEHMAPRFAAMREACIPGAYGLFWALPRTQDWTMRALRLAGWHVVDALSHVFGQGWPKGRGQLKPAQEAWILCRDPRGKVRPLAIDACRVRRSWAERPESWFRSGNSAKPDAEKISGAPAGNGIHVDAGGSWPTNTLISHAPACCRVGARKVRSNAQPAGATGCGPTLVMGTAALNGSRGAGFGEDGTETIPAWQCLAVCSCGLASLSPAGGAPSPCACGEERWWACPVAMLDGQSGELHPPGNKTAIVRDDRGRTNYGGFRQDRVIETADQFKDSGGASRFYPCFHYDAKASRAERQAGCEGLLWVRDDTASIGWRRVSAEEHAAAPEDERREGNVHSTIKPIGCGQDDGLMRWLVRLVTPDGGPVLDGMMGSGSTGVAAQIEGRDFIGCDIDPGAVDIARARLAFWTPERNRQVLADGDASPSPPSATCSVDVTPRLVTYLA